jgi:hypothetical protein
MRDSSRSHEPGPTFGLLSFAPSLVALAFGWWMLAHRRYLLIDDAYISFRYAANLAHGNGLVWNAGVPVEGYTCPLWVLILGAIALTGVDLTVPSVALSALFGLGCLELLRRIERAGDPARRGLVAPLLLASTPSFAHAMTSGMEETSFAFFTLLGIHLLVRARERPALRAWAGASFAAACLIRPEGPLVTAVALAVEAALPPRSLSRLRALAVPALIAAGVVVVHFALRLHYYGYPFPNTFYAKVIPGSVTLGRGAAHLVGFLFAGGWLLFLGVRRRLRDAPLRPWLIHGYALAGVYCAYLLVVGGDHPRWYRFYMVLLPLPLLATAERLRAWTRAWRTTGASFALVSFCAVFAVVSLPLSEAYEPIVGVIDAPINKLMDDVDRFFDEVPENSFAAVAAIGYVGYRHLGLHILDVWGLTDTHIAHLKVEPTVKFGHDKEDEVYVASMKPDYIYMFRIPAPIPGYDLCWPSENPPAAVYRRSTPLAPSEALLGVPEGRPRRLEAPPPCRPPAFATAGSGSP